MSSATDELQKRIAEQMEFVLSQTPEALAAENAKLRKLCKTLYQLADESYVPFGSANRWMDDFAKAICAMRELGIEVDD